MNRWSWSSSRAFRVAQVCGTVFLFGLGLPAGQPALAATVEWTTGEEWSGVLLHEVIIDDGTAKVELERDGERQWYTGFKRILPDPGRVPVVDTLDDVGNYRDQRVPVLRFQEEVFYLIAGDYVSETALRNLLMQPRQPAPPARDADTAAEAPPEQPPQIDPHRDPVVAYDRAKELLSLDLHAPATARFPPFDANRFEERTPGTFRFRYYVDAADDTGSNRRIYFDATVRYDDRVRRWDLVNWQEDDPYDQMTWMDERRLRGQ